MTVRRLCIGAVVLACALGLVFHLVLRPIVKSDSYQLVGDLVTRVDTTDPVVALTLDDGPSSRWTSQVLDILAAQNATATFFLTGHEVARRPDLAEAIVAAGHEVGNHSYSHNRLVFRFASTIRYEVNETDRLLRAAGFDEPLQFRAPYGNKLLMLPLELRRQGRANVQWDVDSGPETLSARQMADEIIAAAKPGSIILMHVMYDSRATSRAALPLVIEGLRAKGFTLVGLNDLLSRAGQTASAKN